MAYIDFPESRQGTIDRRKFWMSPEGIEIISQWRREGMSFNRIANEQIGISDKTLAHWRESCSALEDALRATSDSVNAAVERSLLKRALGYDVTEETQELIEGCLRTTKRVTKHIPPDTKACLAWLYSRRSDRWRAQQEPLDSMQDDLAKISEVMVSIVEAANGVVEIEAEIEDVSSLPGA